MAVTLNSKLLVEGTDDLHVVKHLLERHGIEPPFEIAPKEGFQKLRKSIYNEVNVSGRSVLGILADANENRAGRWQAISDQLARAGCRVPPKLTPANSVFPGPRGISVGVWLMPDYQRNGELEDFVYDMIPMNDPILPLAKAYIDGIPAANRKFKDVKLTRAYVHAWLASLRKPRPMGTAISSGDLVCNIQLANSFIDWLRQLFRF